MIKKLFANTFVGATVMMYVATASISIGNYLYHLLMARMLTRPMLGELEGTVAFFYIFSVPLNTMALVVIKFTATYKGRGDHKAIGILHSYFMRIISIYGVIGSVILLLLSPFIASFLHLSSYYIMLLVVVSFFVSLYTFLGRSMLQGLTDFSGYAVSNTVEAVAKLLFAFLLVTIGLKTTGAFGAITISIVFSFFVTMWLIRKYKSEKGTFTDQKAVRNYAIPVFLTTLSLTSLFTSDLILVRHFFPGALSGDYSVLSVMGKVIYFAVAPIALVLFPLVSEQHAKGGKHGHFLLYSVLLTGAGASFIVFLYFVVPGFMISMLPGKAYLHIASLLGVFGIFIALYSLLTVSSNYFLSTHKILPNIFILFGALLQIVGIVFFHKDLLQVIAVSITVVFLLLISHLLYYIYSLNKR